MTTVTDPGGTPVVIYNRDGVTIDSITAAGTNSASAAVIPRYCAHSVIIASSASGSGDGIRLSSSSEVGDVVEIYWDLNTGQGLVYPPTGESINNAGSNVSSSAQRHLLRKVSATEWYSLRSA